MFFLISISVLANLNAAIDLFLHPEIPYFDADHIIVGGITAVFAGLFIFLLNLQNNKLKGIIKQHEQSRVDFKKNEVTFQVLTEKLPDMVHLNNEKGEIIFVNPITEMLLGYTQEELLGKQAEDFIRPEQRSIIQNDIFLTIAQNITPPLRNIELLKKDGTYLPVEVHGFIVDLENDKKYIGAILRDISERIENEKQTHALQEWSNTFDSMEEMISVHDENFNIIRINRAFCDFLGKDKKELIGKSCYDVIHGTGEHVPNCPHGRTLHSNKTEKSEIVDPASGCILEVTCSPLLDNKQKLIGSVHTVRDISAMPDPGPEPDNTKNFFPVCSSCKKFRNQKNEWQSFEDYLFRELGLKFTHSICPDCVQELYPEFCKEQ